MNILNLKDDPVHLNQLAEWHYIEWSYLNPGDTLPERIKRMSAHLNEDLLPSTFIAKEDGVLLGSAALVESDMDSHKELTPWLASVFVNPGSRRKGVGSALVKHIMTTAKRAGFTELYLFTPNMESFYKQLGWTRIIKEDYRCETVTIMSVRLND